MLSNGNGRGTASLLANCAGSHFYYFLVCVMAWVAIFGVLHSWDAFCIVCDPCQPTHLVAEERFCFSGMPLQRQLVYRGAQNCLQNVVKMGPGPSITVKEQREQISPNLERTIKCNYWGCSETCVSQMCLNMGHFESRGMHGS